MTTPVNVSPDPFPIPGRSKDPATHPSSRRHSLGSGSQDGGTHTQHSRDAPECSNRASP